MYTLNLPKQQDQESLKHDVPSGTLQDFIRSSTPSWQRALEQCSAKRWEDFKAVMLGPEGWLIDSWTPTFVDKNKECQLGSYDIWNDKKVWRSYVAGIIFYSVWVMHADILT